MRSSPSCRPMSTRSWRRRVPSPCRWKRSLISMANSASGTPCRFTNRPTPIISGSFISGSCRTATRAISRSVIDETDSGQLFVGDTQLEIFLSKVTEKHGFLGQRTVELDHKRFILRPDRSNDYRSSVPKFPRTGILFGIGPNRQARQIFFWDALVVQNNPRV